MINGIKFIDAYLSWLREKLTFNDINGVIEINTPFLDNHNDYIQLYVMEKNGHIVISDDGYTVSDLIMSGCDLTSLKRKDVLNEILKGFGIELIGKELFVKTTERNFPQKKHALLQAVLAVSDMFMLTQSRILSVFFEDVECFFNQNDVRFASIIQISGKSGFYHTYDFIIPASKQQPERLVKAINNPTKEKAESVLFSWEDTKEMRNNNSMMYVFLNDIDKNIRFGIAEAFLQYDVHPVLWSEKEKSIHELAA